MNTSPPQLPYVLELRWRLVGCQLLFFTLFWCGLIVGAAALSSNQPHARPGIVIGVMTLLGLIVLGAILWIERRWFTAARIVFLADSIVIFSWRGRQKVWSAAQILLIDQEVRTSTYRGVTRHIPFIVIHFQDGTQLEWDTGMLRQYDQDFEQFYAYLKAWYGR